MAASLLDVSRARELHAEGVGCNAIARELGVNPSIVSRWAKREGLSFDRSATAVAVQARAVDLRVRRQGIIDRLYTRAERNLARLEAPYTYRVSTATETYLVTEDDPPAADELRHSQALSNYLKTAAQLEAVDSDGGASEAGSLITDLVAAIRSAPRRSPDVDAVRQAE